MGSHPVFSASNTIGGTSESARNIISANHWGIYIANYSTVGTDNLFEGNFIGTDVTGTLALGNTAAGIQDNVSHNSFGGTTAGAGNVISGNTGVGLVAGSSDQVLGNSIGVGENGAVLGNNGYGIDIAGAGVVIGATASGASNVISNNARGVVVEAGSNSSQIVGNTIADNQGDGVQVRQSTGVSILSDSISGNLGLGIDLDTAAGQQPNPNNLLPAPNLTSVVDAGGGQDTLTGIVFPNKSNTSGYVVQFFANPSYAADGTTGGAIYLGETSVATDAEAEAPFTFTYPPVSGDPVLSATVTDPSGDTSEFSTRPPAPTDNMPVSETLNENSSLTLSNDNAISVNYTNSTVASGSELVL